MTQDQGRVPCRTVSTAQVARGADRHSFNGYSRSQLKSTQIYHSLPNFFPPPLNMHMLTAGSPLLLYVYSQNARPSQRGLLYYMLYTRCLAGTP